MNKLICILSLCCAATTVHADTPAYVAVHFDKSEYVASAKPGRFDANVVVENKTNSDVEIVRIGMNSPALSLKIDPTIKVTAGNSVSLAYSADQNSLHSGSTLFAVIDIKDGLQTRSYNASAMVKIKGAPELKPQTVAWHVGDPSEEKKIQVVFPEGQKLASVQLIGPANFEVRFDKDENAIYVKPISTDKTGANGIRFETVPPSDGTLNTPAGAVIFPQPPAETK